MCLHPRAREGQLELGVRRRGMLTLRGRKRGTLYPLSSICHGEINPSSRRAGREGKEGRLQDGEGLQALEELQRWRCERVMRREAVEEQVVQDRSACSVIELHPRWNGTEGRGEPS